MSKIYVNIMMSLSNVLIQKKTSNNMIKTFPPGVKNKLLIKAIRIKKD